MSPQTVAGAQELCLAFTSFCWTMSEWKDAVAIAGTLIAVPGVLFAAYKTWREVVRLNEQRADESERRVREDERAREQRFRELEQRQQEHLFNRTQFTLAQHRRLFDDPELRGVLFYLDSDHEMLATAQMLAAKRKFLTFLEEIVLLRNSHYISADVALYMFGYYALRAHCGTNFKAGVGYDARHWGLFMSFAEEASEKVPMQTLEQTKALRL